MNIIFVSHTNFIGNSAMHVFSIATELQILGHACVMIVPNDPETVLAHKAPTFRVLSYEDALKLGAEDWFDGTGVDLIHAWSPREHVRRTTVELAERLQSPFFVHMEDNEEKIIEDEHPRFTYRELAELPEELCRKILGDYRSQPRAYSSFIRDSIGYTCLVDQLLDFAPEGKRFCVFWPGFDEDFRNVPSIESDIRERHGIGTDEILVFYPGNVHYSNTREVESLYVGLALARRRGIPVRLIRTGWEHHDFPVRLLDEIRSFVVELGFVDRADVPLLMSAADVLIQPGSAGPFNDYRFPSKLPEFLVSGKPVVLPDSNIGQFLSDGVQVLKLDRGSADEIAAVLQRLHDSPDLRQRLGAGSRAFALENLTWAAAAQKLDIFYREGLRAAAADDSGRDRTEPPEKLPVGIVSFYLPQFHPIPENDAWWGVGFTEWTNVVRAQPMFAGHDQPRLPTDLGFYDLRVAEMMHAQAALAKLYGVSAFCFYYYWFGGRRLLEKPLDLWIEKGPDFPFSICWANENWSRRWDGSENEILMENNFGDGDYERIICDILPILKDPRYMKIGDAPILHVYKVSELSDPIHLVRTWRKVAAENGIENLHLVAVQSFDIEDPRKFGFDSAVEFSPRHVDRQLIDPIKMDGIDPSFTGYTEDFLSVALTSINAKPVDYIRYRGCFPRWDNSPRRRKAGHVLVNESPKAYAAWLRFLVQEALTRRDQQAPMIYVNAWNEWGEGAYLEPDESYGRTYLEVTRDAIHQGIIDYDRGARLNRLDVENDLARLGPKKDRCG